MQIKKSAQADLLSMRGIFLQIGLIVALGVSILAFGWSQSEKVIQTMDLGSIKVEEEITEITIQEQKPIEPAKQTQLSVASDILQVVKNDVKVQTNFDFSSEFNENTAIVAKPVESKEEKVIEEDVPFMSAEQMPVFGKGGGVAEFRSWVQSRLSYPAIAQENGISGKVVLQFVIERDGSVGRIKVLASPDKSLAEEAVRVVTGSPKWTPGKQRGTPVPVTYTLPVDFVLQ